ncbi:MAG: hypothetical protein WBH47_15610 [Streptosporangiaceae bacterium]
MSELQAARSAAPSGQLHTDINSVWILVNTFNKHPHAGMTGMTGATVGLVRGDCQGVPG